MISNYATNSVDSFGHSKMVNKAQPCTIGREYIQMITLSNEVEVFSDKGGKYGMETITNIMARDVNDWRQARVIINAK